MSVDELKSFVRANRQKWPTLYVPKGNRLRGRTHCNICGGRTREQDNGTCCHRVCSAVGATPI